MSLRALLTVFVLLPFFGYAQEFKFKHIGKEQGLSQSRVNAITEDKDGFLWMGTDDGLNRYNGREITVFKNNPGNDSTISDNWIYVLFTDAGGQLWIGTLEGGLNRYDKYFNRFEAFRADPRNEQALNSDNITAIAVNDENSFWVGTDNGLHLFDTKSKTFKRFLDEMVNPNKPKTVLRNDNIRCLYRDKTGVLWIGTSRNGLYAYDSRSGEFEEHNDSGLSEDLDNPYRMRIRTIFEDSNGQLWIGYDGGYLSRYDRKTTNYKYYISRENDSRSLSNNRVTSIMEDHNGQLWIATADGINLYDPLLDNFRVVQAIDKNPFSMRDNFVRVLYEDKAHSVWMGTDTYGATVYHRSIGKFNHINTDSYDAKGLLSNTIFCFAEESKERVWIGTIGEGLAVYDRKQKTIAHFNREQNNTHNNILCLEKAVDKIWFGTWGGGLGCYDISKSDFSKRPLDTENSYLSNNNILDIASDSKGHLWIATLRGLNYFDPENDSIRNWTKDEGLPHNVLYCLHIDRKDRVWIGSNGGGLAMFDPANGVFKHWIKGGKNSLANNTVHCIVEDAKGNLWLGTKNGLSRFEPASETFTNFTESDGLSNNFIVGILFDKGGNLWLSTYNGLTKFNPYANKDGIYESRKYFAIDGLQGDEFNQNAFFQASDGEFFFGGTQGFNHFYPSSIVDNPNIPPVVITKFLVAGKEYPLDSSITEKRFIELSYRKNFFSFEFASLDFVLPEKILYSYKMEGLDEDWSTPSTRNFASYTDLQGGDYVFRVKATNNDGVWNEKGVALHIRIIPPFYKTRLFYSLSVFFTIVLVFIIIRMRVASINAEKKRLEEMVAQRTRELAEKNQDIMSSINYARRIQDAILPETNLIAQALPDSFILYRPKDIVSGDFYWFAELGNKKLIASVDCTGHGVPGAFMSMIGHNLLNQIVLEKQVSDPAEILEILRVNVRRALKQEGRAVDSQDGMDLALAVLETDTRKLSYAGAFRPIIIVRKGSLEKIEGVKSPIGMTRADLLEPYITHTRNLNLGDSFYMYSDGYVDQFGGSNGKKFMGKNLHALILEISDKPMHEQKEILLARFESWKGELEQIDDVLIIGVRL